jgi:hypothetical protein
MKFEFTNHAQYRMYARGISASQIKQIIFSADFTKTQNNGKILKVKNIPNKSRISVVYRIVGSKFLIITVYYEN